MENPIYIVRNERNEILAVYTNEGDAYMHLAKAKLLGKGDVFETKVLTELPKRMRGGENES